jgi:beta-galactosidase
MRESISLKVTDNNHPATLGLQTGDLLKGTLYAQSVTPLENANVRVLAQTAEGQPAVVVSRFGSGEAMLVGTYMGMAGFPEVDPVNDRFFTNLTNWAKIERPFTSNLDGRTTDQLELRLQENTNGYLLFAINHSDKSESFSVDLKLPRGDYKIREVISDRYSALSGKDNVLVLASEIERKQVMIWEITPN